MSHLPLPSLIAVLSVVRVSATPLLLDKRDGYTGNIELFYRNHRYNIGCQFTLKMLAILADKALI